ncbi:MULTISPECIES: organic hydroperoxide resistance protein [Lysobacter]|jgi:Ohr subfamily peroxiredoxin|uniref:Organic hydroperoxide resistance protein n=1 Tax=Lysobacter gummosus TaxID=262324 RepID=A0ABY3X4R4_9GAMM|nr:MULTISPECIES: organic hydroperoxide resistance protein [Lysobacter]ALN91915.1 organic hydroperoxide resistance protein [Lysobacter gummosus]UJB21100.1 organic hydroperoxide resistance protein [Lysobacter capsici]UJQ29785.1 organic hydroperoxide resistance protein [Lysobacter gummosus]UNP27571.1 organic hydroperoxide resistance protein [Lysobacter gummosus]
MIKQTEQVLYTAHTHTTGGRDGSGRSSDGAIDVKLSTPGSGRPGSNPEQLFGIGYSACFIGAMQLAGARLGIKLPADAAIDAAVSLGKTDGGASYLLSVKLTVILPGLDDARKHQLVEAAHQTCPYSHATRGNVDVEFEIV